MESKIKCNKNCLLGLATKELLMTLVRGILVGQKSVKPVSLGLSGGKKMRMHINYTSKKLD